MATDAAEPMIIGNNPAQTTTFDGEIEEVRLMKTPPPNVSQIIKSEYEMQNSPTVITLFPQEQYPKRASDIVQDILTSANTDQPTDVTWTLQECLGLIPTENLIASYDFEDSIRDQTSTNNGTMQVGTETYTEGKLLKGFKFDGFRNFTLANEATFDVEHSAPMSWSFWIDADSIAVSRIIVGKRAGLAPGNTGYSVSVNASGFIRWDISNGTTEFNALGTTDVRTAGKTHVVVTYGGKSNQDNMKVYINKVLENTGATSVIGGTILNALTVSVGARNDGTANQYKGMLDELKFYKKELQQADIDQLFDEGNSGVRIKLPLRNHWESLDEIAKFLGLDLHFDNEDFRVFVNTKGKTFDPQTDLDVIITSKPEITTDDFANQINMIGKTQPDGTQLEKDVSTSTVLRFNYEKVISDNQLSTQEQLDSVGQNLLDEVQKLTPQIKGTIPFNQFVKLNLSSGDVIKIAQPEKQLNASFRVMDIKATSKKVNISLESTETGTIRLRSLSFADVISGILKRIEDQAIES